MQGTLNEIDIRSILQLIALGQRTGELFVEAYPTTSFSAKREQGKEFLTPTASPQANADSLGSFWFVFFVNGQIVYVTDHTSSRLGRLRDYLVRYQVSEELDEPLSLPTVAMTNVPEYAYLWRLLEMQRLTPAQGRKIIESMVRETLFDLFSLHQGSFIFEIGRPLAPQLTCLDTAPLIPKIMKQVQQWKQFYPHIRFPSQYLTITNETHLQQGVPEKAYHSLCHWAKQKTSLRQLSRYLNRDLVTLARGIYPYVERGWIHLVNEQSPPPFDSHWQDWEINTSPKPPQIVCIDDDPMIERLIGGMLQEQEYSLVFLQDPLTAIAEVFRRQPDLILCDIAMPKLEGYELCAMLRQSRNFRQIPIIMLTGKDAFIDRVRARMVGATDYLTKPFGENELRLLLEQYTKSAKGHYHRSH